MHRSVMFCTAAVRRSRGVGIAAVCVLLVGLLAAIPAAPARAEAESSPQIETSVSISGVPQGQLEALLGGLPLGELDPAEVGKAIAELPGLGLLPAGKIEEAVAKAVEVLAGEGKSLEALLTPAGVVSKLETELKSLLSLPELIGLLKGENLTTLLTSALSSLSSGELVGTLLENSAEPEKLVREVLGALDPRELEALLGSPLGEGAFVPSTVGTLAGELGVTGEALAEGLGLNPLQLPPSSLALTELLPDGTTLGVVDGLEGVSLALFKTLGGATGEGSGEGGSGGNGNGGSGGSGGSGSGTPSGSGPPTDSGTGSSTGTTVVVNYPTPGSSTPAASPARPSTVGKIKILSHKVKHGVATIVVRVPAAGRVTLSGAGVRLTRGQATRAGRLTLRTRPHKATGARHRSGRTRNVRLTATFAPSGGPGSRASVTVRFAR